MYLECDFLGGVPPRLSTQKQKVPDGGRGHTKGRKPPRAANRGSLILLDTIFSTDR